MRIESVELKTKYYIDTLLNQYSLEPSYEEQETEIVSLGITTSDDYLGNIIIENTRGNTLHISLLGLK